MLDTDGDGKGDLPIVDNTCNFIPIYSDQVVSAGNSTKIFRSWQVKDWCNQAAPVTLPQQLIEVKDTGRPTISCPSGNQKGAKENPFIITANNSDCSATLDLSPPTGTDDCEGGLTAQFIRTISLHNFVEYDNISDNLPIGEYYAEYRTVDATGNASNTCRIYFDIKDGGAPIAICTDQLYVSFVGNITTVKVEDIDAGSGDDCSFATKEIRKEGGNWASEVNLSCEEVANNIKVYLRVRDENGGENTCWVSIKGEDHIAPTCEDLSDMTFSLQ